MSSVTNRITEIKQPRGGYIKPSQFNEYKLNDGNTLNENENIHATVIGLVVDYLTRFSLGANVKDAFRISCKGAMQAETVFGREGAIQNAKRFLSGIKTIDRKSIINACKLVTYDVWLRNPVAAMKAKSAEDINPDRATIQNIEIMVHRSIQFWKQYGPIVKDGFTFEPYGYSETVDSGDGDFLTADTMWDFKVSKSKPTSKNTLQLLMYWIMGQHSGQKIYKGIDKLGIFNPRLNVVYLLSVNTISREVISEIEKNVICYGSKPYVIGVKETSSPLSSQRSSKGSYTSKKINKKEGKHTLRRTVTGCIVAAIVLICILLILYRSPLLDEDSSGVYLNSITANDNYILPDSDTRYYTESELSGLSEDELRLARNEIYARHGRKFDAEDLQEYFGNQSWYEGTIEPSDFSESLLNEYEKANVDTIMAVEESK